MKKPKRILPMYRISTNQRGKSTREHERDLREKHIDVKVLSQYINGETYVLYEYPCGHRKEMRPRQMLVSNKGRCMECFPALPPKEHLFTTEEFVNQLKDILPMVKIIGEYTRSDEPISVECLVCGHRWSTIAHTLKQGHGCPKCRYINSRISQKDFSERINKWHYDFDVLDSYSTLLDYYKCRCRNCSYEWFAKGTNLVRGICGCSNCFTNSKGERIIRHILECNDIKYETQKTFYGLKGLGGKPLMFDIYIPQCQLLIEYQGIQHEKSVDRFGGEEYLITLKEHDRRKREYAKQHNISLLEIWYYDYNHIEEILKENLNLESVETVIEA